MALKQCNIDKAVDVELSSDAAVKPCASQESANASPADSEDHGDIVQSLEYQLSCAVKYSTILTSMHKADPAKLSAVLRSYPLESVIYDLFVIYVINCDDCSPKSSKD